MTIPSQTSGALSTNGIVANGTGVITYAEVTGGALALYDGLSSDGSLLVSLSTDREQNQSFSNGVKYGDGLYATISAGTAVLHGTNVAKTT